MSDIRQRDFLGVGWSFPVASDSATGEIRLSAYEQDVKEAIRIILETARGERVMRPDFGCGIHDLVFADMNSTTLAAVEAAVRDSLVRFEPRIEIIGVSVNPFDATNGLLLIEIDYRIRRTNQSDNLVYPFYFKEGGSP
jgi:phage baseplate assembly protein W